MVIDDVLAFVREEKTSEQLAAEFGRGYSHPIRKLIEAGCVRKRRAYNTDPAGMYSRLIASFYIATGAPYEPGKRAR